jgi:hypothetical protein
MSPKSPEQLATPQGVGKSILTALTQAELALLLDALLASLAPSSLETALKGLPSDTRQTLQQILTPAPPTEVKAEKPTSLAKLEQTWSDLWEQWNDIASEATDEEGKYIEQEEHWEPPYFDDNTLVEDLEPTFRTLSVTTSQKRKGRESKYLSRGVSWRQAASN